VLGLSLALVLSAAPAEPPRALTVSGGYLGEFVTQPGIFASFEWPLVLHGGHVLFTDGRVGVIHHPAHSNGISARAELGYRYTASFGLYGEALAGLGAYHSFLDGAVYVVNGSGVTFDGDTGRPTFLAGMSLGVGWQFPRRFKWPDRVFLRADGWLRAPVNGMWLPGVALSLGLSWTWGGNS